MATLSPEEGETTVVFESDGTNRGIVAIGSFDCVSLAQLTSVFRLSVTPQIRLDRAGNDSLTVSWDAPSNYPASGYDLQYRVGLATDSCTRDPNSSIFCDSAMQVEYDSASPGSGVEITGLEPDTSYQVSVRARDAFPLDNGHFSRWAQPLSAMTRPENSDPTGQPVIQLDGQPIGQTAPRVDDTLSVDVTGISDADGLSTVSYAYRWLRAGTEIAMATGATYMVKVDDVGSALSVRVSFTDDGDNEEALTSATTAAVAAAPPVVTMEAGPDVVEGDTAVFTLRRTGDMSERLSVDYEVEVSVPDPTVPSSGIAELAPGASEIEVRISTSEDRVATSGHDITLTIVGGDGSSEYEIGAASSATVSVTDDDAAPRITNDTTSFTAPENSTDTIVELAATDEDDDVLTWSIVGGADRDAFRLRTLNDGMRQVEALSFTEAQDFEAPGDQGGDGTYEVTVEVTDGFNPVTAALTVALTAAPPVVTMEAGPDVVEGDTAVFTLRRTGDMSERLSVDYEVEVSVPDPTVPSSGIAELAPGASEIEVRISTSEDKVATSGHDITLTIVGGDGSSVYEIGAASSATVSVTDDDAAPRITNDTTSFTAPENSTDTIVELVATDEDGDVLTWSIVGGADRDAFRLRTLNDGMRQVEALSFTEAQDFEAPGDQGGDGTYEVTVEVTDGFNPVTAELTVALTAAPPVVTMVVTIEAGSDVVEGDTAVFTLRRTGDMSERLSVDYEVEVSVPDPTVPSSGIAELAPGASELEVRISTSEDKVATSGHDITLTIVGGDGSSEYEIGAASSATVSVTDDDAAPRITNDTTSFTAPENSTDTIVELAATDEDGDVLTWSIVGGADRDAFRLRTLNDGMRQVEALSFTEAQDFEAPGDQGGDGTYEVTVEVTDGFNPVTAGLTVALTAAPPVVTMEAGPDVVEGDTAVFTLRRSGTTTALLDVNVSVSEDGDVVAPANEGTTTVAFGVGAATTTLLVATMDDTQAREHSTVTVAFTPGVGYVIGEPASAAVPVRDNDEAPAALAGVAEGWLSRFGRTVSGHVSDAVWLRLRGEGKDSRVELAGRRLGPAAAGEGRGVARARWTGGEERMGDWPADDAPTPTVREVLLGSSFRVGLRDGGAPGGARWTSWGEASASRFDSEEDGLALDGEATTFIVGLDAARAGWLAGVAFAGSAGEGEFGDRTAGRDRRGPGKVASWLASVHPYARFAVSERLSVWGLLGHGTGDLELEADGAGRWKTDTSMAMAAAGARGVLLSGKETGGAELGIRADALIARLESDAATDEGGELAATRADTSRLRLMLEGSRPFALDAGGMIEPSLEAGVRHDGGDAETGTGVALGGGLRYHAPAHGLTVDTRIRGFIADGDTTFREWGASGSVRIRAGREGAGLSLTVSPAFGADSSGAARLWSLPDARGLAATGASEPAGRLDAELGYGLGARPGLGVVTPYAGLGLAGAGARAWRLGVRLRVAEDFTADLGATRCEVASDDAPEHAMTLRAKWRW